MSRKLPQDGAIPPEAPHRADLTDTEKGLDYTAHKPYPPSSSLSVPQPRANNVGLPDPTPRPPLPWSVDAEIGYSLAVADEHVGFTWSRDERNPLASRPSHLSMGPDHPLGRRRAYGNALPLN